MTNEQKLRLGELAAQWIEAEWQRRALKADRAKAFKIATKSGIDVDYDTEYDSIHAGRLFDERPEIQHLISRVINLDAEYRRWAPKAGGLRAAITRFCRDNGIALRHPNEEIAQELDAMDPVQLESA